MPTGRTVIAERVLAAGIGFTEGPLWTADGRLLVTSVSRGQVVEIDVDAGGVVGTVETGGGPNGLAEGGDGSVWVAQNGGAVVPSRSRRAALPGLQRLAENVVVDLPLPGAMAPNDLVLGPDSRIWYTDPGPPGRTRHGRLCAVDPGTGAHEVLLADLDFPNGLAVGVEGDVLHLAHTSRGLVSRWRWDGTSLRPDGISAELPAGGPDGLAVDAEGRLHVAAPDADLVHVFAPDGALRGQIGFTGPAFPTNVCFAGDGLCRLVITAAKGGRVLVCDAPVPGRTPSTTAASRT